ncbi:TadE/TadG family type IV pilus assembly protein [Microbacterium paludicola]|uniref:TadE/TadG family type IV pilus assembly protein n=1 Tax=Microbacterium paludicola TaxID=300019 RepID=UPI0031CF7B2A
MRSIRHRVSDDRGLSTAESSIIWSVFFLVILTILQAAVYLHGYNLAQAAAAVAVEEARLYDAGTGDGYSAASSTAEKSGGMLNNISVNVSRSATQVSATVTGDVPLLVPGMNLTVTGTASGPVERWVD